MRSEATALFETVHHGAGTQLLGMKALSSGAERIEQVYQSDTQRPSTKYGLRSWEKGRSEGGNEYYETKCDQGIRKVHTQWPSSPWCARRRGAQVSTSPAEDGFLKLRVCGKYLMRRCTLQIELERDGDGEVGRC
jgi:hypothetical protein